VTVGEARYVEEFADSIGDPNAVHAAAEAPEYHWKT
jgi:hypothetical protein